MRCPECGETTAQRPKRGPAAWRHPVEKAGKTWRVHECRACRKLFVSIQTALTAREAGAWAQAFEPPILPESGSTDTPPEQDNPLARLDD